MGKILDLDDTANLVKLARAEGKRVALVTGCFDVVHVGHIQLFRFALEHADMLVVGVDSDAYVRRMKGASRPIYNLGKRSEFLAGLRCVSVVFPIENTFEIDIEEIEMLHKRMMEILKPDCLVTCESADIYTPVKKIRAEEMGFKLICDQRVRIHSTTEIVRKLQLGT